MKITLDIKPSELSLFDCVELLGRFYSSQDPITWKGEDTTPDGLIGVLSDFHPASTIRIDYYGMEGREIKNGTLTGMLADRAKCKELRT